MAKKGQAVQLQAEINSDEEWEKLLEREGLIVVDVYSEWCGPCSAMSAVLKKIKLEHGGDQLQLAMAKCDEIEQLSRFRQKSEPTWLFISNKKIVNLMYGADSPKLQRLILDELKREQAIQQGHTVETRVATEISEMFGEEVERYEEEESVKKDIIEREAAKKKKEEHDRKEKEVQNILETMESIGVCLIFPHAKDKYNEVLHDIIQEAGLTVKEKEKIRITEYMLNELNYFLGDDEEELFSEATLDQISKADCIALLIKPQSSKEMDIPKIDRPLLEMVYGPSAKAPGDPNSPAQQLMLKKESEEAEEEGEEEEEEEEEEEGVEEETQLIGIWVPQNVKLRATTLKLFFKKYVSDSLIPEPPPTPEHIAVIFDLSKKDQVQKTMEAYPNEIMRYGIFTSEDLGDTKLVAKSFRKLDHKDTKRTFSEKLIIQLSRKVSECVLEFAGLGPIYMSPNTDEGKRQCRNLFPENYDEPEIEEPEEEEEPDEEHHHRKKKRHKREAEEEDVEGEDEGATDEDEEDEGVSESEGDEEEDDEEEGDAEEDTSGEFEYGVVE